ncbi:MAG: hypothetical protein JWN10_923 [Solirubrobacterales bacterium]|nr:hypothetical protein [Solirubrobacterales bacterium]
MPVWGFVLIWFACGVAIALILGHALRTIDEAAPVADSEPLPQPEWPEFREANAQRLDEFRVRREMRSHAILVGDRHLPDRRGH